MPGLQMVQQIGPVAYSGYLGRSVDLVGDVLVAGANGDDLGGTDRGSISIYRRISPGTGMFQVEDERRGPTSPENGAQFGYAVAMLDEDTIVVGAPYKNNGGTNRGSVFVFTYSGGAWSQVQEIQATADNRYFGFALDSDGVRVVVGAPEIHPYGTTGKNGWVSVYTWSGSQLVFEDSFEDGNANDSYTHGFGTSVGIHGDTVVAGAPSVAGISGRAFVFVRSGSSWSQQQELSYGSPHYYGQAVAVFGDCCAVADEESLAWGSVDVWNRTGTSWSVGQTIWEPNGARDRYFGRALEFSSDGQTLFIGAPGINPLPQPGGVLYRYDLVGATWTWDNQRLYWDPPATNDQFACDIAYDADTYHLAVGANNITGSGTQGGIKVYYDAVQPYLQNQDPAPNDTGVDPAASVYLEVVDDEDNLDPESVEIYINGTLAWWNDRFLPGFTGERIPVENGYSYSIQPGAAFEPGTQSVHAIAEDTTGQPMDETYSFTTRAQPSLTDQEIAELVPAPGIDLKLDSQHDVYTAAYDLVLVAGVEEVAQHLLVGLRLFYGEWYLDEDAGMPYYRRAFIAGPSTRVLELLFHQEILGDADIERIKTFELEYDRATRKLDVEFVAVSSVGLVEVEAVLP